MKVPNSKRTRQILSSKTAVKALYSALSNPGTPIPLNGRHVYLSSITVKSNGEKGKSRPK